MPHKHYLVLAYGNRQELESMAKHIEETVNHRGMLREFRFFDVLVSKRNRPEAEAAFKKEILGRYYPHNFSDFQNLKWRFVSFLLKHLSDDKRKGGKSSPNLLIVKALDEPQALDG